MYQKNMYLVFHGCQQLRIEKKSTEKVEKVTPLKVRDILTQFWDIPGPCHSAMCFFASYTQIVLSKRKKIALSICKANNQCKQTIIAYCGQQRERSQQKGMLPPLLSSLGHPAHVRFRGTPRIVQNVAQQAVGGQRDWQHHSCKMPTHMVDFNPIHLGRCPNLQFWKAAIRIGQASSLPLMPFRIQTIVPMSFPNFSDANFTKSVKSGLLCMREEDTAFVQPAVTL